MILGQPLTQARWQQKVLFRKVRSVALAHDTLCTTPAPVPPAQSLLSTIRHWQTNRTSPTDYFSDTLLGGRFADVTGSYTASFEVCALVAVVGAVASFLCVT